MQTKLVALFNQTSKHSNYQSLPSELHDLIPTDNLVVNSRFEFPRMKFITSCIDLNGVKFLDVGGNTGFFTFESLYAGASKGTYIEGNKAHADFVSFGAKILNKNIDVFNKYLDFKSTLPGEPFDVVFLLNVIHHLGDDYGDTTITLSEAKSQMADCIRYFADKTQFLILQMGFCWKGNRNLLLFENGTKSEMISFIEKSTADLWEIKHIGIAEKSDNSVKYMPPDEFNIMRNDELGEFLNRPIFILESILNQPKA